MQLRKAIFTACFLAAASLLSAGNSRGAEWMSPPFGGSGGSPFELTCGEGSVLIGLDGRRGNAVDQLALRCRKIVRGTTLGPAVSGGSAGGNGGSPESAACPSNMVVTGLVAATYAFPSGTYLSGITLTCAPWVGGRRKVADRPIGRAEIRANVAGEAHEPTECPYGTAIGLRGRSGAFVDQIQLICK